MDVRPTPLLHSPLPRHSWHPYWCYTYAMQ